jgi:hypothetical protein
MIWRVLPLVKINTRISETPCIFIKCLNNKIKSTIKLTIFRPILEIIKDSVKVSD